jgi:hypothetical protein
MFCHIPARHKAAEVNVTFMLLPTISRPEFSGVKDPSEVHNQIFIAAGEF